jgi:hypothetical protein
MCSGIYLKQLQVEAATANYTHSYSVFRGISMRAKKKAITSKFLLKTEK